MRAQRIGASTYQLFDRGEEIGYIDGRRVGFRGIASAADAGVAAWASAQELRLRRRGPGGRAAAAHGARPLLIERAPNDLVLAECDIVADIKRTPGEPHQGTADSWGFEICSPGPDGPESVIVGQARIMWRGIRARRAHRLMEQFASPATV